MDGLRLVKRSDSLEDYQNELVNKKSYNSNFNTISTTALLGIAALTPNVSSCDINKLKIKESSKNAISIVENYVTDINNPLTYYIQELDKVFLHEVSRKNVILEILSFKSLINNWDGYSALPLEVESANNAIKFISVLSERLLNKISNYYPNTHGTVTLELENDRDEIISIEIGNRKMSYYVEFLSQEVKYINNVEINNTEISKLSKYIQSL
jgi:hypothetical protein